MFDTTIAGSLPKPGWLAEPNKLWRRGVAGAALDDGKRDATLIALKLQEDCGVDVVTDGEQSRQHFVHGFLEAVDGIDFAHKVEIGIRADRYKAMVPQVVGELRLKGRVHGREERGSRALYPAQAQIHAAGTDDHRRHHRRRPLRRPGQDGDGIRRPAQRRGAGAGGRRRRRHPVRRAGVQRLHGRGRGLGHRGAAARSRALPAPPPSTSATATASRPISTGRRRSAANGGNTSRSFRRWRRAASAKCRSSAAMRACR